MGGGLNAFYWYKSADPAAILPNLEPIQDFIAVLVTCKNEFDPIKMKVRECS